MNMKIPVLLILAATAGISCAVKEYPREVSAKEKLVSNPPNFEPALPKKDVIIFAGMGDNFVPPEQPEKTWEAWGEPRIVWFSGGHVVNFEKKRRRAIEREFLENRLQGRRAPPFQGSG